MNFVGKRKELENIILSEVTYSSKDMYGTYKWVLAIKYRIPMLYSRPKETNQEGKPK